MNYSAITCAIIAMASFAGAANAAVATNNVPMTMAVSGVPTCTVANSNASIVLASATMAQTVQNYLTNNSITTPAIAGNVFTSAALNQTATISCSNANTSITSILVQPGTNAKIAGAFTGYQLLVDQAATPTVAGGVSSNSGFLWSSDLVSVNGTSTPASFVTSSNLVQPYTTSFTTGALSGSTSTATFVWRPTAYAGTPTAVIGNPTGGSFSGSYQIVVNY